MFFGPPAYGPDARVLPCTTREGERPSTQTGNPSGSATLSSISALGQTAHPPELTTCFLGALLRPNASAPARMCLGKPLAKVHGLVIHEFARAVARNSLTRTSTRTCDTDRRSKLVIYCAGIYDILSFAVVGPGGCAGGCRRSWSRRSRRPWRVVGPGGCAGGCRPATTSRR